jgi:hypothetical protein
MKHYLFGALCMLCSVCAAQGDPGISTHNYKHPNKAALAAQSASPVAVMRLNANPDNNYKHPKYRSQSSILVGVKIPEQPSNNPLLSKTHYKTQNQKTRSLASGDIK